VDRLRYRFPKENPVSTQGCFKRVELKDVETGFVVANALGDEVYVFHPNERTPVDVHDDKPVPVCVDRDTYMLQGKEFLESIKNEGISKAVFSRVKAVELAMQLDELFERLERKFPAAFVYLIESQTLGVWIGASPEKLLHCQGDLCSTVSLAGTLPLDSGDWTAKEIKEQADVTNYIEVLLKEFGVAYDVSSSKEVVAGPVRHLMTDFNFRLSVDQRTKFIQTLHPTPAVVGLPKSTAQKLIQCTERHDRLLYSGYLGLISSSKTALYVNLRCAQLIDSTLYCYVGGGYNAQSVPEMEWEETENKADTLIKTLQNK